MQATIFPHMYQTFRGALPRARHWPRRSRQFARLLSSTWRGCARTVLRFPLHRAVSIMLRSPPNGWVGCGTDLLPNLLPKAGRQGDSRGRRGTGFQQLTDFYLRLRGFESHPLRHLIFESFLRLESLRSFPTASLLPKSGDSGGRTTINLARFVAAFTEEIAVRELRIAAPAAGRFSVA